MDERFVGEPCVHQYAGAAYLFDKEPPAERWNWKAELELEQYRHVLERESGTENEIEKEMHP